MSLWTTETESEHARHYALYCTLTTENARIERSSNEEVVDGIAGVATVCDVVCRLGEGRGVKVNAMDVCEFGHSSLLASAIASNLT